MTELLDDVSARPPSESDPRIDELAPSLVFEPDDEEALGAALAMCAREDLAVVPIGGGTRLATGNPPSRLDAYVMTTRLSGVEEHIPADLTVAVRVGTTLDALQCELAKANQFLPLDAPRPSEATIGGILAFGEPGMRRRPGARPRDLLLGFDAVLADGTRIHAGGRVVKNVAGYELMKLIVGSAGTLAVVTRAFFKLRALPEETRTVALTLRGPREAERAWRELNDLPQAPEVAALVNPAAADRLGLEGWVLLLRFEGLVEEVRGSASSASASGAGGAGGDVLDDPPWDGVRDFPLGSEALALRGHVTPARTFHLAESWQDGGPLLALPDAGLVYSQTKDPDALSDRREKAEVQGGVAVLERVPTALKAELDVYGETPQGFELMKRIKTALDPKGILSPGRFVGRI